MISGPRCLFFDFTNLKRSQINYRMVTELFFFIVLNKMTIMQKNHSFAIVWSAKRRDLRWPLLEQQFSTNGTKRINIKHWSLLLLVQYAID